MSLLFLNTLLCKQGCDNRLRFLLINCISYISFLFINSTTDHKFLALMVLFISAYFSTMSALRRLKDANLNNNWLAIAVITYLLTGLAIIFITLGVIDLLLLIPATLSALLLTYPSKNQSKNKSKNNQKYHWGYKGPIDLSRYNLSAYKNSNIEHQQVRIEPVFSANEQNISATFEKNEFEKTKHEQTGFIQEQTSTTQTEQVTKTTSSTNKTTKADLGETIRQYIFKYKKINLILMAILLSLLIIFNIHQSTNFNSPNKATHSVKLIKPNDFIYFERTKKLDMPDNFTLFFNQYGGLIIHWQADQPSATQEWSLINAKGDDSCQLIHFNKGETFRTLTVRVENNINHYANFSPLDTQKLLQAIAFRGNFTICDFKFSLKGSQAALNKNSKYAEQVNY